MTRWTIKINAKSREDDNVVMKVLKAAATSGLKYTVRSEEINLPAPPNDVPKIQK